MEFCVHENLWRFRERARRSRNCSGIDENRDPTAAVARSEEHTSELQSPCNLVCRLLLEKKKICEEYWNMCFGEKSSHRLSIDDNVFLEYCQKSIVESTSMHPIHSLDSLLIVSLDKSYRD